MLVLRKNDSGVAILHASSFMPCVFGDEKAVQ